jgi:hypothetical protein
MFLSSLYIVACSIACSRLILHLKESSRQALYRNKDIPTSWGASFALEASVPSLGLRRSEMMFGFGSDRITPPNGVSGSFEEIDMIERDRGGSKNDAGDTRRALEYGFDSLPLSSS